MGFPGEGLVTAARRQDRVFGCYCLGCNSRKGVCLFAFFFVAATSSYALLIVFFLLPLVIFCHKLTNLIWYVFPHSRCCWHALFIYLFVLSLCCSLKTILDNVCFPYNLYCVANYRTCFKETKKAKHALRHRQALGRMDVRISRLRIFYTPPLVI